MKERLHMLRLGYRPEDYDSMRSIETMIEKSNFSFGLPKVETTKNVRMMKKLNTHSRSLNPQIATDRECSNANLPTKDIPDDSFYLTHVK